MRREQVELVDERLRAHVEVLEDVLLELLVGDLAGAERVDVHADRLRDADRVGDLHLAALREARRDDVLRDEARVVAGRAIDLRRVLAAEGAAAVTAHAAVGVDDDLAAGEAGVAVAGRR